MVHCTRGPDVNAPRRQEPERRPSGSASVGKVALINLQEQSLIELAPGLVVVAVCAMY